MGCWRQTAVTMALFLAAIPTLRAGHTQATDSLLGAWLEFRQVEDSTRTKVWWFHGNTPTTLEGITADLEAFKEAGIGGVVFYDQVHGSADGAIDAFSPTWWKSLKFAAAEAQRLGLSFEITVSNGFVAGGPWIGPETSMKRLCSSDTLLHGGRRLSLRLKEPSTAWFQDIAVLAVRMNADDCRRLDIESPGRIFALPEGFCPRALTYTAPKARKSRVGAMQIPSGPSAEFSGMAYTDPGAAGRLESSFDGIEWSLVRSLPTPGGTAGLAQRTIAFEWPENARFVRVVSDRKLRDILLESTPRIDNWEIKAGYFSDFSEDDLSPSFGRSLKTADIIDLSRKTDDKGRLRWKAPKGDWLVVRFAMESTGGRIKHGRANLMGLECSKLSAAAAELQWISYAKPILDTLRFSGTPPQGVIMDSHEAGPQNWEVGLETVFRQKNHYDLRPWLFALRGYIVESPKACDRFLRDFRCTLAEVAAEAYFGTFDRLCRQEGLDFTAQAAGNCLNLIADNLSAKQFVSKPQGEFWARDQHGSLDILDCASAAHLYGRRIASAEAFTDATYAQSPAYLKQLSDYAFCRLINELVVCASAYQPRLDIVPGNVAGGRQYCLNRNNPIWPYSRGFWEYQARCCGLLRKGEPVVDVLICLGRDAPLKTLAYRLPRVEEGYTFNTCPAEAIEDAVVENGELVLSSGMHYRQLVLQRGAEWPESLHIKVEQWKQEGLPVTEVLDIVTVIRPPFQPDLAFHSAGRMDDCLDFGHRRLSDAEVYFVYNHSPRPYDDTVVLRTPYNRVYGFDPTDGKVYRLSDSPRLRLRLDSHQSMFLVATAADIPALVYPGLPVDTRALEGKWTLRFDPAIGGPSEPILTDTLFDWSQSDDARVRYYSGTAVYETDFRLESAETRGRLSLKLDNLQWMGKVSVNGTEAGIIWCSPWEVDITEAVKSGDNHLRIEVTNSLYNRMIGDASLPEEERYTHASTPLVQPSDTLISSGITVAPALVWRAR